jgi:hypothetical protein
MAEQEDEPMALFLQKPIIGANNDPLDTHYFTVRATRPMAITTHGNTSTRDRIKAAQSYNMEVSQALEMVLKNGPRSVTKGLQDWNLEDGIILYHGHVYIPKNESLRWDIIKSCHENITTGHPGRWKTYEIVTREFWWPGMSTFVRDYVDSCAVCQSTKIKPKTKVPLQPNQVPTDIWGIITMDFITDLHLSKGYDSLFVVVDHLHLKKKKSCTVVIRKMGKILNGA